MSEALGLGKIITTPQQRDAIHVAVVPVEAAMYLSPGDHVAAQLGKRAIPWAAGTEGAVGIVDPFLTEQVRPGQVFWLFLYPGSITSLRHAWTHPAFPPEAPASPFEGVWIEQVPDKENTDVLDLTIRRMIKEQDFSEGPLVADAMEEAGIEMPPTFLHELRSPTRTNLICTRLFSVLYFGGERAQAVDRLGRLGEQLSVGYVDVIRALERYEKTGQATPDDTWAEQDVTDEEWEQYWKDYELIYEKAESKKKSPFFTCPC